MIYVLTGLSGFASPPDSLLKQLPVTTGGDRIDLLNQLSKAYKNQSRDSSLLFAQEALELSRRLHVPQDEVAALINVGEVFLDDGNYGQALDYFRHASEIAETIDASQQKFEAFFRMGVCYYFRNSSDSALTYAITALNYYAKNGMQRQEATINSFLGYIYLRRSMYAEAYQYYQQALRARLIEGDQNEIAKSFNAIGTLMLKRESYQEALQFFQQSADYSKRNGNLKGIAISEAQIGHIYALTGDFEKARSYLSLSLKASNHTGIQKDIALTLQFLGDCYTLQDDYDSASYFFQEAFVIREKLKDDYARVELMVRMAHSANYFHDFDRSLVLIDEALTLARPLSSPELLNLIFATQANAYLGKGDSKKFMEAYRKNLAISDTLQAQKLVLTTFTFRQELENLRNANQKQEQQYLQEKQQFQGQLMTVLVLGLGLILALILILYFNQLRSNRKITRQNQVISATINDLESANNQLLQLNDDLVQSEELLRNSNNTKDRFFSILAHDLRGPLASLSMYLDEFVIGNEAMEHLHLKAGEKLRASVGSLNDLLDNLLLWAQNQSKGIDFRPKVLNVKDLITLNAPLLIQIAQIKNISLRFVCPPDDLEVEGDKDMIELIIRNLVSNAIKFTHPGGQVTVHTFLEGDQVAIDVSDTGIGMTSLQLEHLFDLDNRQTRKGTGEERGAGLGLVLVKDFIANHEGTLEVVSEPSLGSTFKVRLAALITRTTPV